MQLALCFPAYRRNVDVGHLFQAANLGAVARHSGVALDLLYTESCSISWSRNSLLHRAMKRGADWALMCDADTFHPKADDVLRMVQTGEERQAAVIASPVRMRGREGYNVFEVGDDRVRFADPESWKGSVTQVHRIGTGFFAVSCRWIKDHWPQQPWFLSQQLEGEEPRKIGEDVTFCDGVRERGGTILADGRFEPVHVGA